MASPASTASRTHDNGDAAHSGPSGSGARAPAEVVALTTRDDFLLELGEALSGQSSIRPVDSIASALENLRNPRRVQILIIDARETTDLRGDVERAHAEAPHASVLVFATAESEKITASSLKGTNVFAVLPSPVDKRKTAAVFEGAVADVIAKRSAARPAAPPPEPRAPINVEPASIGMERPNIGRAESSSGGEKRTLIMAGAAAGLLLLGGLAWFFMRGGDTQPADAPATAASAQADGPAATAQPAETKPAEEQVEHVTPQLAETPLVKGTVDELLEKARLAMRERRYTEPEGDNALLYYRSAAAADATNGEAIDGLSRVSAVLSARFDEAMEASQFDDAALALANMKIAKPGDPALAALELRLASAQITKALGEGNLDRAAALVRGAQQGGIVPAEQITKWRGEINRRQDEARQRRLIELAQDRIREGRLTEPNNDNAKHYINELRAAGASNSVVQRLSRDLGAAAMRRAREAALGGKQSEADRWLAEARSAGVSSSEINSFQRDIANARQRAAAAEADRLAQLARERIGQGRLTEPAQDSAAHYLSTLQSTDSDHSAIATVSRELAAKLLERARNAAREGKSQQVEADLAQARKWGADAKEIQAVQQLTAGNRATASRRATPPADLQSRLKRTRYIAPEYPERALSQRIEGSVTVEFIVRADGDTDDVRIVESEPAGVFDRAAISAVRRWRYEPIVIDNIPTDVPTKTVIRFALPK